jgi:aminomethyltransferase
MPVQYAGIVAEHQSVRERAGLFDVSHMGRLEVTGSGALDAVNRLITNDLLRIPDGKAVYACCCRADGGILDDVIVYRHNPQHVTVVCNASNHGKILHHFESEIAASARLNDVSSSTSLLALQGPRALDIVNRVCSPSLPKPAKFEFAPATIGDKAVILARTGYTGEDGFEIFLSASDAAACWNLIMDAGIPMGLGPIGLGARDTLRLEACLPLYGHEIDEAVHPFEAGLGFAVKLDKREFLGQPALRAKKEQPATRKLSGLMITGRGVARDGYAVLDDAGHNIGHVTSGAPSPTLGRPIALAYLPIALATVGNQVYVDCRGKSVLAEVVPIPFYKRNQSG